MLQQRYTSYEYTSIRLLQKLMKESSFTRSFNAGSELMQTKLVILN